MKEIECKKCANCDIQNDCCKKYGSDPSKAVAACAAYGFSSYKQTKKKK